MNFKWIVNKIVDHFNPFFRNSRSNSSNSSILPPYYILFGIENFKVRGWCPSPRQERPSSSKSIYKDNYIYLYPKASVGLEPKFSQIQDISFYH